MKALIRAHCIAFGLTRPWLDPTMCFVSFLGMAACTAPHYRGLILSSDVLWQARYFGCINVWILLIIVNVRIPWCKWINMYQYKLPRQDICFQPIDFVRRSLLLLELVICADCFEATWHLFVFPYSPKKIIIIITMIMIWYDIILKI